MVPDDVAGSNMLVMAIDILLNFSFQNELDQVLGRLTALKLDFVSRSRISTKAILLITEPSRGSIDDVCRRKANSDLLEKTTNAKKRFALTELVGYYNKCFS